MRRTWLLVALLSLVCGQAYAASSRDLRDVRIVGSRYTTAVLGASRDKSVNDAAKARFLVLKVAATLPRGSATLFGPDFVLAYSHRDGSEDRADCSGIAGVSEDGSADTFQTGSVPRIQLSGGDVKFALFFLVEQDVERVDLYILGQTTPVPHTLGSLRSYSIFLTTNRSATALTEAEQSLRDGGYFVETSTGLNQSAAGVTIIYHPGTEIVAREISQRLINRLKVDTKLKSFKDEGVSITSFDVLVWIGK
jgi:hypothetical protein